jgi:hypothetical protein
MTGKMDPHLVRSIFTRALAKPLQCPFKECMDCHSVGHYTVISLRPSASKSWNFEAAVCSEP